MTKTTIVHALLLEDSAIDAELLERHLLRAGGHFDLWRASGRQSFMEAMEQGGFDIILADYSLPDFDVASNRLKPIPGLMPDPTCLPGGCYFSPRCPDATDLCRRAHPADLVEDGHLVKCHHPGGAKEVLA